MVSIDIPRLDLSDEELGHLKLEMGEVAMCVLSGESADSPIHDDILLTYRAVPKGHGDPRSVAEQSRAAKRCETQPDSCVAAKLPIAAIAIMRFGSAIIDKLSGEAQARRAR